MEAADCSPNLPPELGVFDLLKNDKLNQQHDGAMLN